MKQYPKWLYHATKPAQIVEDADKHAEAGPGWYATPGEAAAAETEAPVSDTSTPVDPAPPASIDAAAQDDAEAKSLYATPVPVLIDKLTDCTPEILERVQRLEAQNPRGARKGVLTAIEGLLAAKAVRG